MDMVNRQRPLRVEPFLLTEHVALPMEGLSATQMPKHTLVHVAPSTDGVEMMMLTVVMVVSPENVILPHRPPLPPLFLLLLERLLLLRLPELMVCVALLTVVQLAMPTVHMEDVVLNMVTVVQPRTTAWSPAVASLVAQALHLLHQPLSPLHHL